MICILGCSWLFKGRPLAFLNFPHKTAPTAVAMARVADIAEVRAKAAQIEVRGIV